MTARAGPRDRSDPPSIDALMRAYLAEDPKRRRRRRDGGVLSSLQLLQSALEGYGYQYVRGADLGRWQVARDEADAEDALRLADDDDDDAPPPDQLSPAGPFCRMFGVKYLVPYLDEFFDDFLIRKVLFSVEMTEATIEDVRAASSPGSSIAMI